MLEVEACITAVLSLLLFKRRTKNASVKLFFILSPGPQIHLYHNVKNPTKLTTKNGQEQVRRSNQNVFFTKKFKRV